MSGDILEPVVVRFIQLKIIKNKLLSVSIQIIVSMVINVLNRQRLTQKKKSL